MSWYSNYLSVYEKSPDSIPSYLFEKVKALASKIQSNDPVVSVVLIAHNEETRLLSCIWSLSENKCKYPLEIIGIENNSTDATVSIFKKLDIPYYIEYNKGPGFARQCGLDHAQGKYYLCIDSDTMYPPHYIETMVNELKKPGVVGVTALWSFIKNETNSRMSLLFYEFCRDLDLRILFLKRPELIVRGMVFGFHTDIARKYGFRTDILRGEDGSLANNLKEHGKICFLTNRKARALTGYGTLSQDGSLWNAFKVRVIKQIKGLKLYLKKASKNEYEN